MRFDLSRIWYQSSLHPVSILLLPFSWLFGVIVAIRRWLYQVGLLRSRRFSVPVIVAGNITVGGTGKTPFIIWLAEWLKQQGYQPGIVSRGYGGSLGSAPHWVTTENTAKQVGDEPLLIHRRTGFPLVIGADRAAAVDFLLERSACNIVLSDDGLQHYGLARDVNIILVDGVRRFGNGQLLPAGPLREPLHRLSAADFIVVNGGNEDDDFSMSLIPLSLVSLTSGQASDVSKFAGKKVHAVAGIGHPDRFFQTLSRLGMIVVPHVFSDHYQFTQADLDFGDDLPIVMTEKDAVKCAAFVSNDCWYLKVDAKINHQLEIKLLEKIRLLEK